MRHTRRLFLALFFATGMAAFADSGKKASPEEEAQRAAIQWLTLVDEGKYGASWDETSSQFKEAITRSGWENALQTVRPPLGGFKSRKLKSATFTTTMPGYPDGEYVIIEYETRFEKKASAVETITPERVKNDTWRVSGYYIK